MKSDITRLSEGKRGNPAFFAKDASSLAGEITYLNSKQAPNNKKQIISNKQITKTNALNLITLKGITPHPIPLPSGERGG